MNITDRQLAILACVLPDDAYEMIQDNYDEDLAFYFKTTPKRVDQIASRLFNKIRQYKIE